MRNSHKLLQYGNPALIIPDLLGYSGCGDAWIRIMGIVDPMDIYDMEGVYISWDAPH